MNSTPKFKNSLCGARHKGYIYERRELTTLIILWLDCCEVTQNRDITAQNESHETVFNVTNYKKLVENDLMIDKRSILFLPATVSLQ